MDRDERAAPRLRVDASIAAGLRSDAVDRGEPETGALSRGFRGEERLERARYDLGTHPNTRVGYREPHIATRRDPRMRVRVHVVERDVGRLDDQAPSGRHRVTR